MKKRFRLFMRIFPSVVALCVSQIGYGSEPVESTVWDPMKLEAVLEVAERNNSTGVVIFKDGQLVVEKYWPDPDLSALPSRAQSAAKNMSSGRTPEGEPLEDVASVQKSVVATLCAIAREKQLIDYDHDVNRYLGEGWSKASEDQESRIKLRHLMTMTTGLANDLTFQAEPGVVWQYNTNAYQLIMRALEAASGESAENLTSEWLTGPAGMTNTHWVERAWARASPPMLGLVTTPQDLARFGLVVLNHGAWNGRQVIPREGLEQLLRPSQELNPSYGMLWWLNREEGSVLPTGKRIEGKRFPLAPETMVMAMGALNRFLFLLPEESVVIVRTGFQGGDSGDLDFAAVWWETLAPLLFQ